VFKQNRTLLENYTLVDTIETADIVVFPIDYAVFLKQKEAFLGLLNSAKKNNKPIWVYTAGDYGFTNYIDNSYTFRLGGFESELDANTYILPNFINDPYKTYLSQGFSVLKKEKKPSVGFVGHAQSGVLKYIKEYSNYLKYQVKRKINISFVDSQPFYPSSIKRAKFLRVLANSNLDTAFILRDKYRAGSHSELTQKESSQQFYDNIFNTSYTFCIRGVGNFSVRFYETLAVGRIPILLNTDCRLPLLDTIDWSKHCLILDANSKQALPKQILEFHESLSEAQFESLQQTNRNLWLNTLQREPYFLEIAKQFKTQL
jgi:hypothetical protein